MATLSTHFSKVRLLLATLSAVGLTLGPATLVYAQDIPTPTPPADGGDFDGAPDPTPGPEATPDPVPTAAPEPEASPELEDPGADVAPAGEPNTDVSAPATSAPGSDAVLPVGDEPANEPTPTELPAETAPESPENEPTDAPAPTSEAPATNEAPVNNSPRGLW